MITVVVATYNGEKYILPQLISILDQTIRPDEVIISDDCSQDSTVMIVKDFIEKNRLQNWRIVENERNLGYTLNYFSGISMAQGDIIFLSDQDDLWLPNKVEVMMGRMDSNPNLQALSSRYSLIDKDGNDLLINPGVVNYVECFDGSIQAITVGSLIGSSYIRGCSMCFRKKITQLISPMELSHLLGHDWMINMLASLTGENECLNICLYKYRIHDSNVSLSAINRKSLIGDKAKRILGLEESIAAHKYFILSKDMFPSITHEIIRDIKGQIDFEYKRLKFLEQKNILLWFYLGTCLKYYRRYYRTFKGAFKVWFGDFFYAYEIKF